MGSNQSPGWADIISSLAGNLIIFKTVSPGIRDDSIGFEIIPLEEEHVEDGCCRMAREGQGSRLGTGFRFVWLISINKSDVNSELWKICARKNDFLKPQLVAWQRGRNDRTFVLTSLLTSFNGAFKRGTESQRVSAGPWNLKSVGGGSMSRSGDHRRAGRARARGRPWALTGLQGGSWAVSFGGRGHQIRSGMLAAALACGV